MFFCGLFICLLTGLFAQSPYFIPKKRGTFSLVSSAVLLGGSSYLYLNIDPLSEAKINSLNASNINSFDRFATENNSTNARTTSDILLATSFVPAIPLLFNQRIRDDYLTLGLLYSEAAMLTVGTTLLSKSVILRPRPFVYNSSIPLSGKTVAGARTSFFSGHTSITAMNSFFVARVYSDYFPDSKWKPYVWTAAILLPAGVGYARVEGGEHFPTDVIMGYLVGGAIGYFVPAFHKKKEGEQRVSFLPKGGGIGLVVKLN